MKNLKIAEWILRLSIAGEFIGHGVFALQIKEGWFKYFTALGFTIDSAKKILPVVGAVDVAVAIIVILKPIRIILLWMAIWGMWTAILRPLGGDPIWDFIERWANWGAPLALLFLRGWPKSLKEWFE